MHGAAPSAGGCLSRQRGLSTVGRYQLSAWQAAALCVVAALAAGGIGRLSALRQGARLPAWCTVSSSLERVVRSLPMANAQPPLLHRPAVLLFGDSLTERSLDPEGGWGAAVAHYFARKVDVINRGYGGYNTKWALPALKQVLAQLAASKQHVLFATLWLGANDAAMPDRSAVRQHVPLADFASNLDVMVAKMQAAHISRIVLITPPPVYDEGRIKHQQQRMGTSDPVPPDRTNAFTEKYVEAVRAAGAKHKLPVLDLHAALQREEGWQTVLLNDGLHFTPAGQALVGRMLIELLQESYPELNLEKLPNQFPWWDKFAEAGPGKDAELWQQFLAAHTRQQHGGGSGSKAAKAAAAAAATQPKQDG